MTRVTLERQGDAYTVLCRGHATREGALPGEPEGEGTRVCAGISCLCCALAQWLENNSVRVDKRRLEPGEAEFRFSGGALAEGAFTLAATGFLQLQETAPQRVRVKANTWNTGTADISEGALSERPTEA